jgi:hypothetical protein
MTKKTKYPNLEKIADSKGSRVSNVVREILINHLKEGGV